MKRCSWWPLLALPLLACQAFSAPSTAVPNPSVPPPSAPEEAAAEEERPALSGSVRVRPSAEEMARRQWENAARLDGTECRSALESAGFRFSSAPDREAPDKEGCGIPHGVVVTRGPTGIAYAPPLTVDCSLALRLGEVERIVQQEASNELHTSIVKIRNLGAYACRHRRSGLNEFMSEHAFGMAVDLSAFEPKKGRPVLVVKDFPLGEDEDATPRASFLRRVYARLRSESGLSFVLGPDYNAQHRDHFHLDHGYRWWM